MPITKIDILANLKIVKNNIKKVIQNTVKSIDFGGKGGDDNKSDDKKGSGIGGAIALLGVKIGLIVALLKNLQPIMDLIKIITAFVVLIGMKILKIGKGTLERISQGFKDAVDVATEAEGNTLHGLVENALILAGITTKEAALDRITIMKGAKAAAEEEKKSLGGLADVLSSSIPDGIDEKFKPIYLSLLDAINDSMKEVKDGAMSTFDIIDIVNSAIIDSSTSADEKSDTIAKGIDGEAKDILDLKSNLANAIGLYLVTNLPNAIWSAIKTGFTDLVETIRNWRPFGKGKNVDDVIITKAGQVLNTNPNDTIIATQNPGGNNGGSVMNFYGVTPQEMLETMKRQLAVDKNRATRF